MVQIVENGCVEETQIAGRSHRAVNGPWPLLITGTICKYV
jgi:hypothetical protein